MEKIKLLLSAVEKTQKAQSNFSALHTLWQQTFAVSLSTSSIILSKNTASQREFKVHGGEVMLVSMLTENNLPITCKCYIFSCHEK